MQRQDRIILLETKLSNASERERVKIELGEINTFLYYAAFTWVKVIFYYKRNEMNERLNRVGRIANYTRGGRVATRNLTLIPASDHPAGGSSTSGIIKYYDCSRAGAVVASNGTSSGMVSNPQLGNSPVQGQWRSFGRDRLSIVTAWWDMENGKWVSLQ